MKQKAKVLGVSALVVFLFGGSLLATPITSPADPALSGAAVIDFDDQTIGSYTSLAIGGVTLTANDNHLRIADGYSGQYNTQGLYLDNGTYSVNGFSSMTMTFGTAANAFGFNWGASDYQWLLSAYDASNNLLDSYNLPITNASNGGDFVGLAVNGIDHALLSTSAPYDWIMIDNFAYPGGGGGGKFAAVPAPGAILLSSIGASIVGWLRRRRTL